MMRRAFINRTQRTREPETSRKIKILWCSGAPRSIRRSSLSQRGSVYLITLLAVLVVSGIAVIMADGVGHQARVQRMSLAEVQCRNAAHGILRAVVNDLTNSQTSGVLPGLVTVTAQGESIGNCAVLLLGRGGEGGQRLSYELIRENGKIDVNNAALPVLLAAPGMTSDIAAAIMDWRDIDSEISDNGGAESTDSTYQNAAVPYAPRNGLFQTLDEVRLVRGVTDALFFGEDNNSNGRLDVGEDRNGDGQLTLGFRDVLCIDSREPAIAPNGTDERTPITSNRQLRARLIGILGEERGTIIADQARQAGPFANRLDFMTALDFTDDEMLAIWPQIIGPEGRLGLIDAWSVDETVLRHLVSAEIANAILAARPATFSPNPAWLINALTRAQAKEAGQYFTCGSYQFRADIIAVEKSGAGWFRVQARIDCAIGSPYVTQLRTARYAGWPFPWISPPQLRQQALSADIITLLTTER
jgi:Type II secretion system (T2SS), protein K